MKILKLKFQDKLALLVIGTTCCALLLASGAFIVYGVITNRNAIVHRMKMDANYIGYACAAALRFDDASTARDVLAVLGNDRHVKRAAIYADDGEIFATYGRVGTGEEIPAVRSTGHRFTRKGVDLFQPVVVGASRIGTVYIHRDVSDIVDRLRYDMVVAGVVLSATLLLALLGSARFQRMLTRPINELLQTAEAVRRTKDYAIRARKLSGDELALLTDRFNGMLSEIQVRDAELRVAQGVLEQRVRERTRELQTRTEELERFNRAAVGRELRMVELKKRINKMAGDLGEEPVHDLSSLEEES